ncbi:CPBP family intramembrane glutamic endopeptidase [Sedimentitalea nanhaiensis]|uniref:CAAX prenyl protease 2/Lysostaphin resistance protein A-like domain-containing protein n=1 Tax=Sedimentitalea nanhaiensis TaxID=999627 RepID=A0A1I7EAY5_9RHOB|nr:CPBP family intramembrane glutamic endopeptidase [Sedimentitalea nanhaiensis]SFU21081.1 hypothetical protein SAMN05216236_15616 [Sedimentitalea nanhaiensis]
MSTFGAAGFWPQILTWLPFIVALAAVWNGCNKSISPFLVVTALLGWWFGLLTLLSILIFAILMGLAALQPLLPKRFQIAGHGVLVLVCLALGFQLIPGVDKLNIVSDAQIGPNSEKFSYSIGLEKPFIFMILLVAVPWVRENDHARDYRTATVALLMLVGVFLVSLAAGFLSFEFSLPRWLPIFFVGNLFLTCLPEEAFFRGYIQRGLASQIGVWPAIGIASLLFGFAHFAG